MFLSPLPSVTEGETIESGLFNWLQVALNYTSVIEHLWLIIPLQGDLVAI